MFLRINVNKLKSHSNTNIDKSEQHIDYDEEDDDGPSEDEFKDELDSNNDSLYGSEVEDQKQDSVFRRIKTAIKEFKKIMFNIYRPKKKKKLDEDPNEADMYRNPDYYTQSCWFILWYVKQAQMTHKITTSDWFSNFIIFVIIIAGINVGIQTYDVYPYIFDGIDVVVLSFFIMEALLKIIAEGTRPWHYFSGPEYKWNCFDFVIIIMSLEFTKNILGGSYAQILRLVRLARLGKLIKKIPPLQRIVKGLIGGMISIGYILLLMFIVFYLYAIVGFYLFSKSNPFYFGDIPTAMLLLYRIATLENWTDVLYLTTYGCDEFPNFYVQPEEFTPLNRKFWCTHPQKNPLAAPIYFLSFVIIASFVLLSLFVGTITMSMNESMEEMRFEMEQKKKETLLLKNRQKMMKLAEGSSGNFYNQDGSSRKLEYIDPEALKKFKLLIVYSSSNSLRLLTNEVKYFDFSISHASNSNDALELMKNEIFDVVMMELEMPEMEGIEAVILYRKYEKENSSVAPTKILGICSDTSKKLREASIAAGFDDIAEKPFKIEDNIDNNVFSKFKKDYYKNYNLSLSSDFSQPSFPDGEPKKFDIFDYLPQKQVAMYKKFREERERTKQMNLQKFFSKTLKIALGSMKGRRMADSEEPDTFFKYLKLQYSILSDKCFYITQTYIFQNIITLAILVAAVSVGAQTDPRSEKNPDLNLALNIIENVVLYVFLGECVFKIVAEKFKPFNYFYDSWNCFDILIVMGSFIPGSGSLLILLRLLRLLRIIKLAKAFPQLSVIVNALIKGMISIGYVGLILLITFYVFAILGMVLFQETDPWHFGSLHLTLLSLFRSATLDNWWEVLYISIAGCEQSFDVYKNFPEQCKKSRKLGIWAVGYTLIFLVIASQVLLVLFIGVISTSMDETRDIQKAEEINQREIDKIVQEHGLSLTQINAFKNIFETIDLEKDKELAPEEIELALPALDLGISSDDMKVLFYKLDPTMKALDASKFIRLILMTPKYVQIATTEKISSLLRKKVKKRFLKNISFFDGSLSSDLDEQKSLSVRELEAAIKLQRAWRKKHPPKKVNKPPPQNVQIVSGSNSK